MYNNIQNHKDIHKTTKNKVGAYYETCIFTTT